jgi:hypothetical protein
VGEGYCDGRIAREEGIEITAANGDNSYVVSDVDDVNDETAVLKLTATVS